MKRKGRSSNSFPRPARHLFPASRHPIYWLLIFPLVLPLATGCFALAEETEQDKKSAHENDFLLFGTVFTQQGFALPGAEIRVRRAGERKTHWEAHSNGRGDFAVHVPRGAEYELIVKAKGFEEQSRKIDAKTGDRADMVFRLVPAAGGKPK